MTPFNLIDPAAPPAENVGAVLAYREEAEREAERLCEAERRRIARGRPSVAVLRAVEQGVAPPWVMGDLRRAVAA